MSKAKNLTRRIIPSTLWRLAGFVKRLPMYWRLERNEGLRVRKNLPGLPLHLTDDLFVQIPESASAYTSWRSHGLEEAISHREIMDFVHLAAGRRALFDVGAQMGFVSSVFARSRPDGGRILSLEPDPQVASVLQRAKELNAGPSVDWQILHEAVSDREGTIQLPISNILYEPNGHTKSGGSIKVRARTLSELAAQTGWMPDIVKIDVESFEYEVLTSSLDLIGKHKPALQLEIHWGFLRARGRAAMDFLGPLAELGYRGIRRRYHDLRSWEQAGQRESVSRFSLAS